MPELKIPEGTVADKNRGTEIVMDEKNDISADTTIRFGDLGDICLTIDGFYEVMGDESDIWVKLYAENSINKGICGLEMVWRELPERIKYGNAEIVDD